MVMMITCYLYFYADQDFCKTTLECVTKDELILPVASQTTLQST